jgi:hypothetical protein
MAPASAPRISNAGVACLWIAPNTSKARGILAAAAYIANSNDACVRPDSAGTSYCGRTIAAMEKPHDQDIDCRDRRCQPKGHYCCH